MGTAASDFETVREIKLIKTLVMFTNFSTWTLLGARHCQVPLAVGLKRKTTVLECVHIV